MKAIQMFFEMLVKYQQIKTEFKITLERHKTDLKLYYLERVEELISKYKS